MKLYGAQRVMVFCFLTFFIPTCMIFTPLYLRNKLYADVVYAVTESDIMEISDGVSTVFCSSHTLKMNHTFNAFQMGHKPEVTSYRKHIRLKKSMTLPDDTLEYWGFYLLRGATVALSVCSRFPGASILVVKGDRTLSTCGMLDHNRNKARGNGVHHLSEAHNQVKITYETNAQEIHDSRELAIRKNSRPKDQENHTTVFPKDQPIFHPETLTRLNPSVQTYLQHLLDSQSRMKLQKQNDNIMPKQPISHAKMKFREGKTENILRRRRRRTTLSDIYDFQTKDVKKRPMSRHPVSLDELMEDVNVEAMTESTGAKNLRTLKTTMNYPPRVQQRLEKLAMELEVPIDNDAAEVDSEGQKIYIAHHYEKRQRIITKRSPDPVKPPALLDRGIKHGGNAPDLVDQDDDESSVSSFEEGLFDCYEGNILLAAKFEPSDECNDVTYLESGKHTQTHHNVTEDGYYYYIFYSDNDIVFNDIHTIFDIYKPTFQYENVTKSCINQTECEFPIELMSNDRVIVEIPTRDGIEHEDDDVSYLISSCHPRFGIYMIFPFAILFFILGCAFL